MMKTIKSFSTSLTGGKSSSKGSNVQLLVSNLEPSVGLTEWRRILFAHFQAVIPTVHQIMVYHQLEGGCYAVVKLSCVGDAQLAIMQLNRRKIGVRRIRVSMLASNCPYFHERQKKNISKLLISAPGHVLPVGRLMQQLEKKFHCSVSLSELQKMRDVVEVRSSFGGRNDRLVALTGSNDQHSHLEVCF